MKGKEAPLDLVLEVLRRMQDAGVLANVVLIGSWALHFYRKSFKGYGDLGDVRTMDMDFMIPTPPRFTRKVDLAVLLKDLGFIVQLGREGFTKFIHSEMDMDFLVPERGRGSDKPRDVDGIGVRAQSVRYADFLLDKSVACNVDGLTVRVPDPAHFALHKLIISEKRKKVDKAANDRRQAVQVLGILSRDDSWENVKSLYLGMPGGWKNDIQIALGKSDSPEYQEMLSGQN